MAQKYLTPEQVATQCDRTPDTVRVWIAKGLRGVKLPAVYRGGSPVVRPVDLEQWFIAITAKRREAK